MTLNIPRRHKPAATDTIFSDTPAVDSGVKQAQVFLGWETLVADAYPMKVGSNLLTTLRITSGEEEPWKNSSVIMLRLSFCNKVMDILSA